MKRSLYLEQDFWKKKFKLIFSFKKILRKRKKILKNTNLMFGFRNKNTKENQI